MALRQGQREASIEADVLRDLLGFVKADEVIVGASYLQGGFDNQHRVVFLLEKVNEEETPQN